MISLPLGLHCSQSRSVGLFVQDYSICGWLEVAACPTLVSKLHAGTAFDRLYTADELSRATARGICGKINDGNVIDFGMYGSSRSVGVRFCMLTTNGLSACNFAYRHAPADLNTCVSWTRGLWDVRVGLESYGACQCLPVTNCDKRVARVIWWGS